MIGEATVSKPYLSVAELAVLALAALTALEPPKMKG